MLKAIFEGLPEPVKAPLRRMLKGGRPAVGRVRFGDFGTTQPVSTEFGQDRGTPIDRIYIERFLAERSGAIRGRTLEVVNDQYTARFGAGNTSRRDVIDKLPGNEKATITADILDLGDHRPETFDAIVLTQTLHLIYDMRAAVKALHRSLKPGGSVLVTVPGLSPIDHHREYDTWYWALTEASAARLFGDVFGPDQTRIVVYGNVFTATCFIQGLCAEELDPRMFEEQDRYYPVIIGIHATKA